MYKKYVSGKSKEVYRTTFIFTTVFKVENHLTHEFVMSAIVIYKLA